MAVHSGGQAFHGHALDIGDVTALVKPGETQKDEEAAGDDENEEDGKEKEKKEKEPPAKRRRRFDYDKQVSKAQTRLKETNLKFKQDVEDCLE